MGNQVLHNIIVNIQIYCMVFVVPPPEINYHPMDITVNYGSKVTFSCISFSHELVTYTWLRNGTRLENDDVNISINSTDTEQDNNTYTTTLMIIDVQLSDNGVYICSASNREGTTSSNTATLSVIGKLWLGSYKYFCIQLNVNVL